MSDCETRSECPYRTVHKIIVNSISSINVTTGFFVEMTKKLVFGISDHCLITDSNGFPGLCGEQGKIFPGHGSDLIGSQYLPSKKRGEIRTPGKLFPRWSRSTDKNAINLFRRTLCGERILCTFPDLPVKLLDRICPEALKPGRGLSAFVLFSGNIRCMAPGIYKPFIVEKSPVCLPPIQKDKSIPFPGKDLPERFEFEECAAAEEPGQATQLRPRHGAYTQTPWSGNSGLDCKKCTP